MLTNVKTYVRQHDLCREMSSPMTIWLHLRRCSGDKFRIYSHSYMGTEMYWDGTGIEPLVIDAPEIGDRYTRSDVIASIERTWEERLQQRRIE